MTNETYLLLNIDTWDGKTYQDLAPLAGKIGISPRTIQRKIKKTGKCFINHWFISRIETIKTERGGKTATTFKPGHIKDQIKRLTKVYYEYD